MKYSKDELKNILEKKDQIKKLLSSTEIDKLAEELESLIDYRDYCIGNEAQNHKFKLGDLVYLPMYGEVGFIIGIAKNAFNELTAAAESHDAAEKRGDRALALKIEREYSPRYLTFIINNKDDKIGKINNEAFSTIPSKPEPKYLSKGIGNDSETRIRYPKENTIVKIFPGEFKLSEAPTNFKTDLENYCKYQCIFSNESCNTDCLLYKYRSKS